MGQRTLFSVPTTTSLQRAKMWTIIHWFSVYLHGGLNRLAVLDLPKRPWVGVPSCCVSFISTVKTLNSITVFIQDFLDRFRFRLFCDRRSVGQSVLVSGPVAHDLILITVGHLRASCWGAPSLTRGRVCNLLVQPYRQSDRSLSAKLVPTFADRECHVVSVTDPFCRILTFLDRSRYLFFQVAPQLYSRGWVDPVPDPLLLTKSGSAENRTQTSGSVARNAWPQYHRGDPGCSMRFTNRSVGCVLSRALYWEL
jgi:hypothetical protein